MLHHLVGAGVFRVGVGHHIVRVEVVLQIGVGQGIQVERPHILCLGEGIVPACFGMAGAIGHIAVAGDVLFDLRHQVVTFQILDAGPPAKVVEAVIAYPHLFAGFETGNLGHAPLDPDRHVADVEDFGVGTQATGRFGHNGGRVGVVEHPGIG